MNYKQAKEKLDEYFKTFEPDDDNEYAQALYKAYDAISDCLEMGLNGDD